MTAQDKLGRLTQLETRQHSTVKNPLKITDVTFRDGHQSSLATRMRTEDMGSIAEEMDKAGFYSVEVWGGATFDVTTRFLNEDPWERPHILKRLMPNTPLQMLLRGQTHVTCRPADLFEPELGKAREVIKDFAQDIGDVLIKALYPITGLRFLKWKYGLETPPPEVKPKTMEDVKREDEPITKAKAGKLVEKQEG